MKLIHKILIIALGFVSVAVANTNIASIPTGKVKTINILLENEVSQALLETKGPYYIFNPYDGSRVSSGLLAKRFIIRATANGIRWGGEFPGIHQITLVPRSPDTSILLNGIQYDGKIVIYKIGNKINVINEIDVESYLKSILTDKFAFPLEQEVMSCIAIANRTTAYYQISRNQTVLWHVKATDINYNGNALIIPDSGVIQAIDATRDLILVNQREGKNVPFSAIWHEHSAGKTAPYNAVFRKDVNAPKIGVNAPHAAADRQESKWTLNISKDKLSKLLGLKNVIKNIETFLEPESKKVYAIRFKNENNSIDLDFFTLQNKLGKDNLKSNDMIVSMEDGAVIFTGYGKGHGVGLCLYSASSMAQNGEIAVKILSKFFPNTFLVNLSAIPNTSNNDKLTK
jgi:stage II sporulation protein D